MMMMMILVAVMAEASANPFNKTSKFHTTATFQTADMSIKKYIIQDLCAYS
jgi:hypothetical protein